MIYYCTAVNASLSEAMFVTNEVDTFVTICVSLFGLLQRPVVIELSTSDGSATRSKKVRLLSLICHNGLILLIS